MTTCPKFLALVKAVRAGVARLDDAALTRAAPYVLDTIGVTSAGYRRDEIKAMLRSGIVTPLADKSPGAAPLIGADVFLPAGQAAMVNVFAGHLDDYDDDEALISLAHCSVPSLMAALSGLAQIEASSDGIPSTRRLFEAYASGVATMVTLGHVMNPNHYRIGWHASATFGAIGAAVATATALGLNDTETATACSLASTQSSGPRSSFGSDAKPYQVAAATRAGVEAVALARAGITSNAPLSGAMGFVELHGGDPDQVEPAIAIAETLNPFVDPAMTIKAFPSCTATHPAIEAAQHLRAKGVGPGDVAALRVELGADVPAILIHSRPKTPAEAKFSAEFCVAAGLCLDDVGLDAFTHETLSRADIQQLIERTTTVGLPEQTHLFRTRLIATMHDGSITEELVEEAEGSPTRPTTEPHLRQKFLSCFRGDGERAWKLLSKPDFAQPWPSFQQDLFETLRKPALKSATLHLVTD